MSRVKYFKKMGPLFGYYVENLDYVCGNFVRPL